MKTTTSFLLAFAATLSAFTSTSFSASEDNSAAVGYWATQVTTRAWPGGPEIRILPGSGRSNVLASMGKPSRMLSSNVWVYRGYKADKEIVQDRDCSELVVTFSDDRVENMKFVNSPGIEAIAMSISGKKTATYAAK